MLKIWFQCCFYFYFDFLVWSSFFCSVDTRVRTSQQSKIYLVFVSLNCQRGRSCYASFINMWDLHMCCLQLTYGVDESYTLYIPDSADTLTATLEVSSMCNLLELKLLSQNSHWILCRAFDSLLDFWAECRRWWMPQVIHEFLWPSVQHSASHLQQRIHRLTCQVPLNSMALCSNP